MAMTSSVPNPYVQPSAPQPLMSPADEKLWAMLVHLGCFVLGFWSSLIGYLVLRDRGPFVRQHTASALNFHLTMLIAYVAGIVLLFAIVGIFVLLAVGVVQIVFTIMAAVAANKGEYYTYPLSITFVR
jgi:uncharacterized Tic20 family protein